MKMTMHIDEALLKRVMDRFGFVSKTETVEAALKEMDRRFRLEELLNEPVEWGENELRDSVAPGYDPIAMRVAESSGYYGHAPEMVWTLDRRGKILPAQDLLIAAHALKFGGSILTSDRHFYEIPGMKVFDPAEEFPEWEAG